MKYYINLVKRKKFLAIFLSLFITSLGCLITYIELCEVLDNGIAFSEISISLRSLTGAVGFLGRLNIGLVIIGIINIYTGLIFIPRNAEGSQNDEDYYIENQEESLYVKCFNREFLIKRKGFEPTDFFFKDKNKKFVSMTRGYQIFNYVAREIREEKKNQKTQ